MAERSVAALLMAAGSSRRMGVRNKLLLPWRGRPLVAAVADALIAGGCDPVVAVLGHQRDAVAAALAARAVRLVHNPDHASGLAGSIAAGVAALPLDAGGYLIALGDMPELQPRTVVALRRAFAAAGPAAIVVPVAGGRRGNPVLFSHQHAAELRELAGDVGARTLLRRHEDLVVEVELEDEGVLFDLDTPKAYGSAASRTVR